MPYPVDKNVYIFSLSLKFNHYLKQYKKHKDEGEYFEERDIGYNIK